VDIAPQPLAPALTSFARQTGQQLFYSPEVVSGKRTRGVQGSLLPSEALRILLDGTSLSGQRSPGGAIVLKVAQNLAVPIAMSDETAVQLAPAPAQSPEAADAPADSGLDIVVTARRRDESLQRTPVSAVAFTSNDLYTRSLTRISELQSVTPGLQVGYSAVRFNPTLAMRGQRRSTVGEGAPAVLIYQNEVPLPTFGSLIPTFDMSSVQVLKGPQGTLFGRNATAGAVLVYSQQPTYEHSGYVDARFTNYNGREFEGALNLPLIADKLAIRIAGQLGRRDGYTKNLSTGPDLDDRHDQSIRISVLTEPTDNFRNIFVFDGYNGDENGTGTLLYALYPNATAGGGNARIPALAPFFDCGTSINCDLDLLLARQQQVGARRTFVEAPVFVRTKLTGVSNTTTWNIGGIRLKNIFGYRNVAINYLFDLDGTALRVVQSRQKIRSEQFTEELQASGKLLNDRLDFIVGGFYLKERPSGINYQALSVLSPGTSLPFTSQAFRRSVSKAIYGQIGYDLSALVPGVKLNAGIRRTKDEVSLCSTGVPGGTPPRTDSQCSTLGARLAGGFKATTWTLGLDWQISRELFAYIASRRWRDEHEQAICVAACRL
jgi:iron complex outermembrane receptor protein